MLMIEDDEPLVTFESMVLPPNIMKILSHYARGENEYKRPTPDKQF